jgi:uncharacterized membrane protein
MSKSKIIEFFRHDDRILRDNRWIFISMLVGSILSLISSFVLSNDAVELAKNSHAALSCSVNLVVNCASVALHPTAHLFGFPNSFIGMMSEPVVITVAIAGLAGVQFPRFFRFVAQIVYTLGLIFALTLLYISMFVIGALCPWCLLVTLTTILVWFAITRYNIRENNLYLSQHISRKAHSITEKNYDKFVMAVVVAIIVAGILLKYGNGLFGA